MTIGQEITGGKVQGPGARVKGDDTTRGNGERFVKSDPRCGRPRGTKNELPGGSIKAIFNWLAQEEPQAYAAAIMRGLQARDAKSYPFVALATAYLYGKPVERIPVAQQSRLLFRQVGCTPDLGSDGE